jgi:hypothetical protein
MVIQLVTLADQVLGVLLKTRLVVGLLILWRVCHNTNINAKLRAMFCGLQVTWELDFRDIICVSDFHTTLTFIKIGILYLLIFLLLLFINSVLLYWKIKMLCWHILCMIETLILNWMHILYWLVKLANISYFPYSLLNHYYLADTQETQFLHL